MGRNMKKFISFSGGVESSTMCVLFGDRADAIFSDTGFEHEAIYERIDLVEKWVQNFHRSDFKIHKVKNKKYGSLIEYIKHANYYPSFKSRFCTGMFKIKPIDDWLIQFEKETVELMIGLNAEEIEQRIGNHGNKKFVNYNYPLVTANLSRTACKLILKKANLYPEFPVYMRRGGCIGCFYKTLSEYMAMAVLNPKEFKIVEDLETEIQDTNKEFYSIIKGLPMSKIRKIAKGGFFKPEEIYPVVNDMTPCGVFCNR